MLKVTARLLTNFSNTLRNIHTNARENITRTRPKRKAGYFIMAHPVYFTLLMIQATQNNEAAVLLTPNLPEVQSPYFSKM
jgi:hypothetical protein